MEILYDDLKWHTVIHHRFGLMEPITTAIYRYSKVLQYRDVRECWYCPVCGRAFKPENACVCCDPVVHGIHPTTKFQKTCLPTVSLWEQLNPQHLIASTNEYGLVYAIHNHLGLSLWRFNGKIYFLERCMWHPYQHSSDSGIYNIGPKTINELNRIFDIMEGGVKNENLIF